MKTTTSSVLALAGLISSVAGHGFVSSPKPRMPGSAFTAACGQQATYNQNGDHYGNVQGLLQVAANQADYDAAKCNAWLCKGYKFDDNTANVQSYTAGQKVDFSVEIRAPHTGTANVSVVDTATNSVIGSSLIDWDVYASTATGVKSTDTAFSVTIPSDLGSKCATAGACVLQWYWDARDIDQTYESCIDFTVSGSGSGSAPAPASSSAAAAPASSSAAPQSSSPATTQAPLPTAVSSGSCTRITGTALASLTASFASASATPAPSTITPVAVSTPLPGSDETEAPSVPTPTAEAPVPTATGGASAPSKPLPSGTTVKDLLEWLQTLLSPYLSKTVARRHARDILY